MLSTRVRLNCVLHTERIIPIEAYPYDRNDPVLFYGEQHPASMKDVSEMALPGDCLLMPTKRKEII